MEDELQLQVADRRSLQELQMPRLDLCWAEWQSEYKWDPGTRLEQLKW